MQNITKIQDKSIWRTIFSISKWLIPVLLCTLLYHKVFRNTSFSPSHFKEQLLNLPVQWVVLLIICACINWSLETLKWRILLKPFNQLSYWKALASVLSGVAVSQLLPYKTGEYLGRLVYIKDHNKLNAALLSIVGSYSQLLITLLFGMISFMVIQPIPFANHFIWLLYVLLIVGFLFYYFLPAINLGSKFPFAVKLKAALQLINQKELLKILIISFIRYVTFLLPYSLLAWHFGLSLNAPLGYHFLTVSCIFFLQTISPNFILTDIALRIAIPVIVFSKGNIAISQFDYVPGLLIYLFNVAIPMTIGAFLIMFAKFKQA